MAKKDQVFAFQTETKDPQIIRNLRELVSLKSKSGVRKTALIAAIEQQLAAKEGGFALGGSAGLIPDFNLSGSLVQDLLLSATDDGGKYSDVKIKQSERKDNIADDQDSASAIPASAIGRGANIGDRSADNLDAISKKYVIPKSRDDERAAPLTATGQKYVQSLNVNQGAKLWKLMRSKSPKDFNDFYEKGSFLKITQLIDGTKARTLNIKTPKNKFKNPPFVFQLRGTTSGDKVRVELSLQPRYIREVLQQLGNYVFDLDDMQQKDFAFEFTKIKTGKALTGKGKAPSKDNNVKKHVFTMPTNLQAVGTVEMTRRKARAGAEQKEFNKRMSDAQLTALIRQRLTLTMEMVGDPSPPTLKNRTGRFINSVSATVSPYSAGRQRMIRYFLLPKQSQDYRSLTNYGYNPDAQIVNSIREVAVKHFDQKYRITRGN